MREHADFVAEYDAAVAAQDAGKIFELRAAVAGSRILGILARDKLKAHEATHEDSQIATA